MFLQNRVGQILGLACGFKEEWEWGLCEWPWKRKDYKSHDASSASGAAARRFLRQPPKDKRFRSQPKMAAAGARVGVVSGRLRPQNAAPLGGAALCPW